MKIKYTQHLSFPLSVISKNIYQTWPSGQNVTLITVNNNYYHPDNLETIGVSLP